MAKANKIKNNISVMQVIMFIVLLVYAVSLLVPVFWTIITAIKPVNEYEIFENKLGFPQEITFTNFITAYQNFYVERFINNTRVFYFMPAMFLNSLIYTIGCAAMATLTPCITAYVAARYKYKFGNFLYMFVVFVMALPIVGSMPATIRMTEMLGIYDTYIGSFIMKGNFLGVYFLVFYAQFKMLPKDYTEAARIDGASNFKVMVQVIMPLAVSTIGTVFLLYVIQFWNDYQTPMVYLPSYPTVAFGMFDFQRSSADAISNWPTKLAGSILMALPIIVVYVVFNKKLTMNVSIGGIKG